MHVLGLSSVFPNPQQPTFGIFVRERLARLARVCPVEVVAPVPWFPFNTLTRGERWRGLPATELQDGLRVHHPRIFCVPKYLKALDGLTYGLSLVPFLARHRQRFPFDVIDAHFA